MDQLEEKKETRGGWRGGGRPKRDFEAVTINFQIPEKMRDDLKKHYSGKLNGLVLEYFRKLLESTEIKKPGL